MWLSVSSTTPPRGYGRFVLPENPIDEIPGSGLSDVTGHTFFVDGGQTLCLVLTLVAVPVFYSLWEDFGDFLKRRWAAWFGRKREPAVSDAGEVPEEVPVAAGVLRQAVAKGEAR